ncbi:CdaR family transcriptional regulator [Lactobacillus porci]|uniref:CdaR family transcriptional regulator n=1 Tax=Lactobacillus porci TaxID=2012477 RepID=UPI00399498AC
MKLDPELAQTIVERMMKEIPYNINIMDETGTIIASGESDRLGQHHFGADRILQSHQTEVMDESFGENGQPGVNMPIVFKKQLVGVVGITGDPQAVKPLASLLKTSTELLLEQQELERVRKAYDRRLEHFLFQWSETKSGIEDNFELRSAAERLGISLLKPRRAIVLACSKAALPKISLDPDDYYLNYSHGLQLFIVNSGRTKEKLTAWAKEKRIPLGIGSALTNIGQSFKEARQVLSFQQLIPEFGFSCYDDVQFDLNLLAMKNSEQDIRIMKQLAGMAEQDEMAATLLIYLKNNGHVSQAADELHIHRNTLKYRLKRFKELTGLDPENSRQLFRIYAILLKLRQE